MNFVSILLILITTTFMVGVINRTKAIASGRKGASIFQPLFDIFRLFRKGSVYSRTTSFIFQIAPTVSLASLLCAMLMIPFGEHVGLISFNGDFIVFTYLLAAGRFMMIVSALDTGSPFEGMGASREAFFSLFVEPAFFVLIGSLGLYTGYSSFHGIIQHIHLDSSLSILAAVFGVYILIKIVLIENSRMPVDDPKTHLELTMVHEVMVLDNSGFDLAIIQYTSALRFAVYGALIANLLPPHQVSPIINVVLFFVVQFGLGITIGIIESFRARYKMNRNIEFILSLIAIAILVFLTALIYTQKV